jgi:hypothetical protein
VDSANIIAVTPAGLMGPVDVVVTNPDGESGILHGGFVYGLAVTPTSTPTVTPGAQPGLTVPTLSGLGLLLLGLTLAGLGHLFLRGRSAGS